MKQQSYVCADSGPASHSDPFSAIAETLPKEEHCYFIFENRPRMRSSQKGLFIALGPGRGSSSRSNDLRRKQTE
eukprot:UN15510